MAEAEGQLRDKPTEIRHLLRTVKTSLELAIMARAPSDLVNRLGRVPGDDGEPARRRHIRRRAVARLGTSARARGVTQRLDSLAAPGAARRSQSPKCVEPTRGWSPGVSDRSSSSVPK
jgi:hypothetical protein